MKKIVNIGISLFLIIFLVTGCKKSFNKDNFTKTLSNNNFSVTEIDGKTVAVGDHYIITLNEYKSHKSAVNAVKKSIKKYDNDGNIYTYINDKVYSIYAIFGKYVISSAGVRDYYKDAFKTIKMLDIS